MNDQKPPYDERIQAVLEFATWADFCPEPKEYAEKLLHLEDYIDELAKRFHNVDPFGGNRTNEFPEIHHELEEKIIKLGLCPTQTSTQQPDPYILRRLKDAVLHLLRNTLDSRQAHCDEREGAESSDPTQGA